MKNFTTAQLINLVESQTDAMFNDSLPEADRYAAAFAADKNTDALIERATRGDVEAEKWLSAMNEAYNDAADEFAASLNDACAPQAARDMWF